MRFIQPAETPVEIKTNLLFGVRRGHVEGISTVIKQQKLREAPYTKLFDDNIRATALPSVFKDRRLSLQRHSLNDTCV